MELYFYTVGCDDFESSAYTTVCSTKLYSVQEFKELCASITASLYINRKELFKSQYQSVSEINEDHNNHDNSYLPDPIDSFSDLYEKLIDELTTKHGFELLKYSAQFCPFGPAQIIPKDHLNGEWVSKDDDLHLIRNKI